MKNNSKVTRLITIGLFIALEIILTRFLSINTPFIRIGFGFLPVAMLGIMYGPVWAGISYAIGDVLGMLIFPSGAFFPGFTLSAALTGIAFGIIPVSYTHLRAHETDSYLVCRLLLEKKKKS